MVLVSSSLPPFGVVLAFSLHLNEMKRKRCTDIKLNLIEKGKLTSGTFGRVASLV